MTESLKTRLQADLKTAMKEKDAPRRDAIRLIISDVKSKEIDLQREISGEEEIRLLQTQAKQRHDSIQQFRAGNREDLVDKEQRQLDIIESYLPSQMSDEDLQDFVEQGVTEAGAEGSKDMGKVMGLLSKRSDGRVDGRRLSEAVRARLAQ
ncbi:MAG: GatB/YqeY domain-containing protein [Chloroflexota bacterium]|jgi:uncharacterized protein YqeY|nr:GatB/YqeY domain-containing protein [Chloroflexota bacterium]